MNSKKVKSDKLRKIFRECQEKEGVDFKEELKAFEEQFDTTHDLVEALEGLKSKKSFARRKQVLKFFQEIVKEFDHIIEVIQGLSREDTEIQRSKKELCKILFETFNAVELSNIPEKKSAFKKKDTLTSIVTEAYVKNIYNKIPEPIVRKLLDESVNLSKFKRQMIGIKPEDIAPQPSKKRVVPAKKVQHVVVSPKDEQPISRRTMSQLIEERVKDMCKTYEVTTEPGFSNALQELFKKFMMNTLESLVRYSAIQNEGHPSIGCEFKLFQDKKLPEGLDFLKPFANSYTTPYSNAAPRKRKRLQLFKVLVNNPLEDYANLLQQQAEEEQRLVKQLYDETQRLKGKRELERDIVESLLSSSKGLTPESFKSYQRALSLKEHRQKPLNKRLTIRVVAVQLWLQDNNMPYLLEKSYLK